MQLSEKSLQLEKTRLLMDDAKRQNAVMREELSAERRKVLLLKNEYDELLRVKGSGRRGRQEAEMNDYNNIVHAENIPHTAMCPFSPFSSPSRAAYPSSLPLSSSPPPFSSPFPSSSSHGLSTESEERDRCGKQAEREEKDEEMKKENELLRKECDDLKQENKLMREDNIGLKKEV
jgi:hypothetical protein